MRRVLSLSLVMAVLLAAFVLISCGGGSSTPTVPSTPPNQHLYVAFGQKVFVYNLPLTSSSAPAVTMVMPGSGYAVNPCLDTAGHIFIPTEIVTGTTSHTATLAFALPLTATSAPVFTLSAPYPPFDCHFDPSGNMYVANVNGVQVFKAPVQSGSAANSTITASGVNASGVWTDVSGGIYVATSADILVYSSFASGNALQATFGGPSTRLALGPSGSLYVASGTSSGEIDVYDAPFTNNSMRNASKTIKSLLGVDLTSLAFDQAGDMFVGVCGGCIPTGSGHILVLQPPYTSVNVDLNLVLCCGVGLTVGP